MIPTEVYMEIAHDGIYYTYTKNGELHPRGESLGETTEEALSNAALHESLPWFWFGKWGNISPKRTENLRIKSRAELIKRGIKPVRINLIPTKTNNAKV